MRDKWNARYKASNSRVTGARVLEENQHLLPASGKALDVACGLGGNALLMARHGLSVDACDISDVAINALQSQSNSEGLSIHASVTDIDLNPPAADQYDVIVVSYFLSRSLFPALIAALRPGGLLFYQTFSRSKVSDRGPQNPSYRLADQELLSLVAGCHVLVYREERSIGNIQKGFRDEVMYVGWKPG